VAREPKMYRAQIRKEHASHGEDDRVFEIPAGSVSHARELAVRRGLVNVRTEVIVGVEEIDPDEEITVGG
jgi:hypothetical protein